MGTLRAQPVIVGGDDGKSGPDHGHESFLAVFHILLQRGCALPGNTARAMGPRDYGPAALGCLAGRDQYNAGSRDIRAIGTERMIEDPYHGGAARHGVPIADLLAQEIAGLARSQCGRSVERGAG